MDPPLPPDDPVALPSISAITLYGVSPLAIA